MGSDITNDSSDKDLEDIREVVAKRYRRCEDGEPSPAEDWQRKGFDADETMEWLRAGCFRAGTARALANQGVDPVEASKPARELGETASIGYLAAVGSISVLRAVVLIGR